MSENYLIPDGEVKLSEGISHKKKNIKTYEIMHMDKVVASISSTGYATIFNPRFMPYDLYFEETGIYTLDLVLVEAAITY